LRKLVVALEMSSENASPALINALDRALSLLRAFIKQMPSLQNAFLASILPS